MNRIIALSRRPLLRAAAMAGLALTLLPAALFPRGPRTPDPDFDHAAPIAASAQQNGEARALLTAVRGIHPIACELALQSIGNGWGWGSGDVDDAPAISHGSDDTYRVLSWLRRSAGTQEDLAALREGLGDADTCVRRLSARLLARDRSGGVDALLATLRSGQPTQREAAILGLGHARDIRGVGPLVALLADADAGLRGSVIWTLGHTDSREAAAAVARLVGDPEPGVRRAVARALGRLDDASSIPRLMQLLASDPDPGVRRAAAWALGRIE